MKYAMKKATTSILVFVSLLLLTGHGGTVQALWLSGSAHAASPGTNAKIDAQLQAEMASLAPGQMTTAIVTLQDQADLGRIPGASRAARQQGIIRALQAHANASQRQVQAFLRAREAQGLVSQTIPFWVFNGLSVTATPAVFQELAARADVAAITPDAIQVAPIAPLAATAPAQNLSVIGAPALWDLGWRGQGVVVANMDSGVDVSHPDLAARWRGGSNSWYDPYGQHPTTPTDLSGHGTWTMGVLVGGDASGTSLGVAPGAQWIAVKMFNDAGSATATAVHQGFQWLLDPDGNPATADAPYVVSNSWAYGSPGCNLEFQLDLRSLRAAGILPVFAAGNYGPGSSTSVSPANYPEAFAVGASDNVDAIYAGSSRGPSACGEAPTTYPELVAPGVNIDTTDRYGLYYAATGTSLSVPHVAGGLALLLSAYPDLSADQQAAALINTAVDRGPTGPDNTFGYGRLDILAAYHWLQAGGSATPTATAVPPTATAIPPTATAIPPTATAVPPTATAIPPTATAVPSLHVGDLDRSTTTSASGWTAKVVIEVHNGSHSLASGVKVTGSWSNGYTGTGSCTTDGTGRCQIATGNLSKKVTSVQFSVSAAAKSGYVYQSSANHDPDGDSNGITVTITKP
jgi:subtilisin family serine protease